MGDRLIATARNLSDLQYLGAAKDVLALSMDVTNEGEVKIAVAAGLERFGRIDVVVNNAGFGLLERSKSLALKMLRSYIEQMSSDY